MGSGEENCISRMGLSCQGIRKSECRDKEGMGMGEEVLRHKGRDHSKADGRFGEKHKGHASEHQGKDCERPDRLEEQ